MALFKFNNYLRKTDASVFDLEHKPGDDAPYAAIYRCTGCGVEVVSEDHRPLPPKNHHQHTIHQGPIRWRLIVAADHKQIEQK
jgi:hypothetical protein